MTKMRVVAGGKLGKMFFWGLLLLKAALVSLVNGQDGVSLRFRGETLPSDSFVDIDDVLSLGDPGSTIPTNREPTSANTALQCITDLVDCCGTETGSPQVRTVRGDWYFPDGTTVGFGSGTRFLANRGPNEIINQEQFYGSVRLFRRFNPTSELGRFHCELPNAANVNQTIYVNILGFGFRFNVDHVTFSPSTGSTTAGQRDYSLTCSSILFQPSRLPSDVPSPNFQWSFGGSGSLPSGVTAMPTAMSSINSTSETYSSTLQFSPLSQLLHAGLYTCRLGPGRLVNSVMVTVNAPPISAMVTANLNTPLMVGQTDSTLTCDVSGADDLTDRAITYQWTRNGVTVQSGSSNTFNFSPLRLSLAGQSLYACSATVASNLLNGNIQASDDTTQTVMIQIPNPESVTLTASPDNILNGSLVTVNCSVELNSIVMVEDLPLLNVSAEISRNGTILTQTSQSVDGTTFNFGTTVNSFCQSDVGSYICTATVRPAPSSQFLTGTGQGASPLVGLMIRIPPTQSRENARCYSGGDIAIAVVVYTLIECLLAVPVITAVMVFCWKRNQRKPSQYKSTSDATPGDIHPGEGVYEDPDRTAVTTIPGSFKLTECPAYVATTGSSPQPNTEAQLHSGYYEL